MRIDKYLKEARIFKRRTIANELAGNERVSINGRIVKPSHDVKVGDLIEVTFGTRVLTVKVLSTTPVKKKQEASEMYEIIDEKSLKVD